MTERIDEAFAFARERHAGQLRKGSNIPYISHAMAVSALALENGADEETAIAALLHDVPEDAGGEEALHEIEKKFGARVARIVLENSDTLESPKPAWQPRKQAYIDSIENKSPEALLVSICDKVHNALCVAADLQAQGPSVWARFTTGRDGTLWYYTEILRRFSTKPLPPRLLAELEIAVQAMTEH